MENQSVFWFYWRGIKKFETNGEQELSDLLKSQNYT